MILTKEERAYLRANEIGSERREVVLKLLDTCDALEAQLAAGPCGKHQAKFWVECSQCKETGGPNGKTGFPDKPDQGEPGHHNYNSESAWVESCDSHCILCLAEVQRIREEVAKARLEEAGWWASNTIIGGAHGGKFSQRIDALRAEQGQEGKDK